MKSQYSDEMINAFVDDELDSRDRENFKTAMESDAELYEAVKSVCALKKSLKQSYAGVVLEQNQARNDAGAFRYAGWRQGVAALLLLCVGTVIGWYSHSTTRAPLIASSLNGIRLSPVNFQQSNKIILHVASSEGGKLETMRGVLICCDRMCPRMRTESPVL